MNNVQIVGRLTRDVEARSVGENNAARFTVAVNRPFKNKEGNYDADFISCTAFGKSADFISQYFHKGDLIGVTGSIRTGSYVNKDGATVYTTDVNVDRAEFVGGKSENNGDSAKQASTSNDNFMDIPDTIGEELPFN